MPSRFVRNCPGCAISAGTDRSVMAPIEMRSSVTGAALRMLGVPTDAPVDNVILPPPGSEIREET